jgi:hypothetical protein
MPWMRVSIGVGGLAVVSGVGGMLLWIDDGSHYFDLAVAVAMAGFLTLVSCVLTRVFGSSHGSQDDAFRRGRSMGYDEGFLEGHRSARPVVVPLRSVDHDLEATVGAGTSRMATVGMATGGMATASRATAGEATAGRATGSGVRQGKESQTPQVKAPLWRRDSRDRAERWDRVRPWVRARRTPLLVGVVSLALLGALGVSELLRPTVQAETLQLSPGRLYYQSLPPGSTPVLVLKSGHAPARLAAVSGASQVARPAVAGPSVLPVGAQPNPLGPRGGAVVAPASLSQPAAASSDRAPGAGTTAPAAPAAPASAAPVVPLTAAEQTAADAKAAADLTAANAAAAAAETARVAAAAAEATRLQALADAYAVAHPGG